MGNVSQWKIANFVYQYKGKLRILCQLSFYLKLGILARNYWTRSDYTTGDMEFWRGIIGHEVIIQRAIAFLCDL